MFGYMGASPGAMKLCADHGVSLTFLSPNGRFVSRCEGPVHGNVLLRKAQYKASEDENISHNLNKALHQREDTQLPKHCFPVYQRLWHDR